MHGLKLLQDSTACARQPFHLPQACLVQIRNRGLFRLLVHLLVRRVGCRVHALLRSFLLRKVKRDHLHHGLLALDLFLRRKPTIHDLAHFARQNGQILAKLSAVQRIQVIAD